ncbi:type I polyketide synthase [Pseudomonas aeruginosa]|uniref:type I polyketide synthase n=1 Tax=Pseudomonas aeruginosa TaxID=287 RepID=UPI00070ABCAC|nr:type I polyketide synthase [Pseudomonas aeruginosa]
MENETSDVSKQQLEASLAQAIGTIRSLKEKLAGRTHSGAGPIAVVGLGCRLPGGADSPRRLWSLLKNATDATGDMPAERRYATDYYDPDPDVPGKAYVMRGGFVEGVERFDAAFFGISPSEAEGMDPQQRIALEVAWEALEHAAIDPFSLDGSKLGVFMGASTNDYVRLRQQLGEVADVNAHQFYGETSFIAGRIAYTLGGQGPAMMIDTSCSSSLVALHQACQSLRSGESDLALAGGVNLILSPYGFVLVSKLRAVASDGRCKTFDAAADGYGRGEGCVVLVLKRLADAERDRDPVLGVIQGSALNNDGSSSGITVPNIHAQQAVIAAALRNAGAQASQVDYIEAHGTGTPLGDPIELRALDAVLGAQRPADRPLLVGSIKANIGHLEPVAGAAGLAKILLALQHDELPGQVNFHTPNPRVEWRRMALRVVREATPWPRHEGQRLAGVSSFGVTGTNAHVLVGDATPRARGTGRGNPWQLFTASGRGETPRRQMCGRYERYVAEHPQVPLEDLCYTVNAGRAHFEHRFACVADDRERLREQLAAYASRKLVGDTFEGVCRPGVPPASAWLFPGQGCQYPGMARTLYDSELPFREALDECLVALRGMGVELSCALFESTPEAEALLAQTRYAQPAIFAVEYALARLWMAWGVLPGALFGHSFGEIGAACIAGALTLEDALMMVEARGRLAQELMTAGGVMHAVNLGEAELLGLLREQGLAGIELAAVNSPEDLVVAGPEADVEVLLEKLAAMQVRTRKLAVSHAFHSAAAEPMLERFREVVREIRFSEPRIPLVSGVSGRLHTLESLSSADYWCAHSRDSVRFSDGVRTLLEQGTELFLEVAPEAVLTPLVLRHQVDRSLLVVPSMRRGGDAAREIRLAAAQLYTGGVDLDWQRLHAHDGALRQALPGYAFQRERYWFTPARAQAGGRSQIGGVGRLLGQPINAPFPVFEATLDADAMLALGATASEELVRLEPGRLLSLLLEDVLDHLGLDDFELSLERLGEGLAIHPGDRLYLYTELEALPEKCWSVTCSLRSEAECQAGLGWREAVLAMVHALPASSALSPLDGEGRSVELGGAASGCLFARLLDGKPASALESIRRMRGRRALLNQTWRSLLMPAEDGVGFDCNLYDAGQELLGTLEGMSLGMALEDARLVERIAQPDVLYRLHWPSRPRQPGNPCLGERGFAVLSSDIEAARQLAALMQARGLRAQPFQPGQLQEALDSVAPCDIVFLDERARGAGPTLDSLDTLRSRVLHPLLALIQAILPLGDEAVGRLWLVTFGAQAAGLASGVPVNVAGAPLWGLGKSMALEHPEHWGGLVDLAPDDPDWCANLLDELLLNDGENQVCLRRDGRRVHRLERDTGTGWPNSVFAPSKDGCYLISGGMGGIGLGMADWLLAHGAGQVVITGRSPARAQGEKLARFGAAVSRVRYVQADIASKAEMSALFEELSAMPGGLRGIFHAAGISIPQDLRDADRDSFDRVLRPKVDGAWLLHELSLGLELEFFAMCSTIACVWGSQHIASYAAANQFLDGLAAYRHALGLPALVVDWGLWAGGSHLFDEEVLGFLKSVGLKPLAPAQGIGLLARLLGSDVGHQVIAGVDWARFKALLESRGAQPLLEHIEVEDTPTRPGDVAADQGLLRKLSAVEGRERFQLVDDYVWGQYANLLGVKVEQVRAKLEDGGSLMDYGLDSLLVMEMVARCRRDLKVQIKAREFLECPGLMWPDFLARSIEQQGVLDAV